MYSRLSDLVTTDVPFKWKSSRATGLRKADLFPCGVVPTETRGSWLQPTSGYHCRTPQPFFGKWDTYVQGKHDCWTECSEPEFCLPFDKMLNRPGNKPWVSWKYIRIHSNVQGHTPGSRKYQNHRVWSKQSQILIAIQNLDMRTTNIFIALILIV